MQVLLWLLSAHEPLHKNAEISTREDQNASMIQDYNATKGRVNNLDKVTGSYSTRRMTVRWHSSGILSNCRGHPVEQISGHVANLDKFLWNRNQRLKNISSGCLLCSKWRINLQPYNFPVSCCNWFSSSRGLLYFLLAFIFSGLCGWSM